MAIQRWNIDTSHSSIQFTVRHMVFAKVRGAFTKWQGTIDFDEANPSASKASARIEAASIDTHEAQRDNHLRSPDFLDAEKHPELTYATTRVEAAGGKLRVTGDLTLHGVTRPVTLEVEHLGGGKDPWGNQRVAFHAHGKLNRKDFGLGWNQVLEAGGFLVGEEVEIAIDVEAVKAS